MAEIRSAHPYSGKAREIANRVKNATDDEALDQAAEDMAQMVPQNAQLIPAPSSSGVNRAMVVLARKIADITPGARVVEAVIRSYPVASSTLLRRAGQPAVTIEEHVESMRLNEDVPLDPEDPVVVIDNVVTEGNTINAVESVLGRPVIGVVYADASRYERPRGTSLGASSSGPSRPLRICVSGSRDYPELEQINWVFSTIPEGVVIVHGGARGVDEYADRVAKERGFPVEVHLADWEAHGRAAGPKRNREMVETCDYVIAFWDGVSRGTASTIQAAIDMGKEFTVLVPWSR